MCHRILVVFVIAYSGVASVVESRSMTTELVSDQVHSLFTFTQSDDLPGVVTVSFSGVTSTRPLWWSVHPRLIAYSGDIETRLTDCRTILNKGDGTLAGTTANVGQPQKIVSNVTLEDLVAQTLILSDGNVGNVLACTTITDTDDVKFDVFTAHVSRTQGADLLSGVVSVIKHDENRLHLSADLHGGSNEPIHWALTVKWWTGESVDRPTDGSGSCSGMPFAHPQSSDAGALRINDRRIVTINIASEFAMQDVVLVLFNAQKDAIYCAPLTPVDQKTAAVSFNDEHYVFSQRSPYHALHVSPPLPTGKLQTLDRMVRDSCAVIPPGQTISDIGSTVDDVDQPNSQLVVSQSLFGENSLFLKTLRLTIPPNPPICATVTPPNGRMATARFASPVIGDVTFYENAGDSVIVLGRLQHMYDLTATNAKWYLLDLKQPIAARFRRQNAPLECPQRIQGLNFTELLGPAIVSPYDAPTIETEFHRFRYDTTNLRFQDVLGKTILLDLDWKKTCVQIEQDEKLNAIAPLTRFGVSRSSTIGHLAVSEPGNGETSVLLSFVGDSLKQPEHYKLTVHSHPIDLSLVQGSPCGWASVGPQRLWNTDALKQALNSDTKNLSNSGVTATSLVAMLSSPEQSLFGKTVVLESESELFCGTFSPARWPNSTERKRASARVQINETWLTGSIVFAAITAQHTLVTVNTASANVRSFNWYIARGDDIECAPSSSQPFNPYFMDTTNQIYKRSCNTKTPQRCVLGDLNGKSGAAPTNQRQTFVLVGTPLHGLPNLSVLNQTLVLYSSDDAETQRICQRIAPIDTFHHDVIVSRNTTRSQIQSELKSRFSLSPSSIAVSFNRSDHDRRCARFDVQFTVDASEMETLKTRLSESEKDLRRSLNSEHCEEITDTEKLASGGRKCEDVGLKMILCAITVICNSLLLRLH